MKKFRNYMKQIFPDRHTQTKGSIINVTLFESGVKSDPTVTLLRQPPLFCLHEKLSVVR